MRETHNAILLYAYPPGPCSMPRTTPRARHNFAQGPLAVRPEPDDE